MKTKQEAIILAERAIDHGSIRAVLREWGYRESEISTLSQRAEGRPETGSAT